MKILFLGHSRIVQRKVLPAIKNLNVFSEVEIASNRDIPERNYSSYEEALEKSKADLVYISTVNSEHAPWIKKALDRGMHVVVDKPATLSFQETEELVGLAKRKGLCLAESTVYSFHPQVQYSKDLFKKAGVDITRMSVTFSMPPLDEGNFRYKKELGGGALWDLGAYVVSLGRVFFDSVPEKIKAVTLEKKGEVESSFSVMATFPGARSLVGHYGFNTEYRNQIELLGMGMSVTMNRFFTTPPDMENELNVLEKSKPRIEKAPKGDAFGLFMKAVAESIQKKEFSPFYEAMLVDGKLMKELLISVGKE